ncbi:MAG TPA: hypothetical protein VEK84_02800 [Terriglobales bacterium]|nr:hypothetical protein [Terriglobales bacterium]
MRYFLSEGENIGAQGGRNLLFQLLHAGFGIFEFRFQPRLIVNRRHLDPPALDDYGLVANRESGHSYPLSPDADLDTIVGHVPKSF